MAKENSLKSYASTVRATARKIEQLHQKFGLKIEARMIFGLFGWEVDQGIRKITGTPISALSALMDGELVEVQQEFEWLHSDSLKKATQMKNGTFRDFLRSEAHHLEQLFRKKLITPADVRSVIIRKPQPNVETRKKRRTTSISYEDILKIETSIVPDHRYMFERTKSPILTKAIAATYLRPIYLLGMRPSEVLDYEFISLGRNTPETDAISQAYKDIEAAEEAGTFKPMQQFGTSIDAWVALNDTRTINLEKTPVIAKIYSRKRSHLTGDHVRQNRYAVLKDISASDFEALFWTSQWRHIFFKDFPGSTLRDTEDGHRAKEIFLNKLRRRLASLQAELDMEPFDLTTLRHNFGTRCRSALSHEEAAALLGHTGPRTTGAYGKRHKRWAKKGGGSGQGWMPTADPETVARLVREFGLDHKDPGATSTLSNVEKTPGFDI